jgi:penicillin-binding protein 1C
MNFFKNKKTFLLKLSASFAVIFLYLLFTTHFSRKDLLFSDNTIYCDRNGKMLRFIPDEKGERHIWIRGNEIPDIVKKAFIAAEDQRFYEHFGFDAGAILRALKDNLRSRRIVSGASTITQQTARLIYPRKRSYRDKFIEILRSVRMEISLSKEEILEQYLNRVPMGNNIIGVELASRIYFGKSVRGLTAAEAAVLASLPKAPGYLNPYGRNRDRLFERKDWVISKMVECGYLKGKEAEYAGQERIAFYPPYFPNHAPHLVDLMESQGKGEPGMNYLAIDSEIQAEVERILKSHEVRLAYRGASQAAALVVHNPTMEVLASVGSISYESKNKGFNNGTVALRSAGSTLKPFAYALALEDGYNVTWLLDDTLRRYKTPEGDYSPANFDREEYGPVTMRTALGNSLNISAIKMLDAIGQQRFYDTLKGIGLINDPRRDSRHYGLGLVIGNPEVSVEQLVTAYAMLSNGGVKRPLRYILSPSSVRGEEVNGEKVFSGETSYIISDILSDPTARLITFGNAASMSFPFRVSVKTGTSTKYRDCWAAGFTSEYTVGVWVGNFEGNPTFSLSGAEGAAPIFKDIIELLYNKTVPPVQEMPENVVYAKVCGISGMKPNRYCRYVANELFIKGTEPEDACAFHTKDERVHELPASYASWLYQRGEKGLEGSYRLKGIPINLKDRIEPDQRQTMIEDTAVNFTKDAKGHFSIGKKGWKGLRANESALRIIYPLPGDHFILERNGTEQAIKFEAEADMPMRYVDWFVDGTLYRRTGPPYYVYWRPEKGRHVITAVTPENTGDSVSITVD